MDAAKQVAGLVDLGSAVDRLRRVQPWSAEAQAEIEAARDELTSAALRLAFMVQTKPRDEAAILNDAIRAIESARCVLAAVTAPPPLYFHPKAFEMVVESTLDDCRRRC